MEIGSLTCMCSFPIAYASLCICLLGFPSVLVPVLFCDFPMRSRKNDARKPLPGRCSVASARSPRRRHCITWGAKARAPALELFARSSVSHGQKRFNKTEAHLMWGPQIKAEMLGAAWIPLDSRFGFVVAAPKLAHINTGCKDPGTLEDFWVKLSAHS